jgi:hypothetical protein
MGGAGAGAALCVELEDGEEDEGQQPQMEEEMVPVVFNSSVVGAELVGRLQFAGTTSGFQGVVVWRGSPLFIYYLLSTCVLDGFFLFTRHFLPFHFIGS